MKENLLVVHGGGPTAVLNASLYGVLEAAGESRAVGRVLAAVGGTGGLLKGRVADLSALPAERRLRLPATPGSAIGTSRDALSDADYAALAEQAARLGVRWVLMTGGNGTMDACGRLEAACRAAGLDVCVVGVPKTMDNDLAGTDHAPGYGSAARYMAGSVAEVIADVQSLPIHVVVIEALGRNAGWVTAAAALAEDCGVPGPDLLYVPERDFDEQAFLADVQSLIDSKGWGVVVASEGLHGPGGVPVVPPVFTAGRATYFGDVSAHLAGLITRKLGHKARSEKPGLLGRASIPWQSGTDRAEAVLAGRAAVEAALAGRTGVMVALARQHGPDYRVCTELVPIRQAMLHERRLPAEFLNEAGNGVTRAFKDWCRPLLGEPLPRLADWTDLF